MVRINWLRVGLHILFWLVYVPLNAALGCLIQGLSVYDYYGAVITSEIVMVPVKIVLVYILFYYVIPAYLERSKVFKFILVSIIALLLTSVLYRLVYVFIYLPVFHPGQNEAIFDPIYLTLAVFDLFITASAAMAIKMVRLRYSNLEYEQELMREKLSAELNFLRAQTNPHFLFNTLNNLYGLARKKSDKTPEAILKLSKIMRFMLYECREPRIQIAGEMLVIKDYIELEKLRYSDRLQVHYQEEVDNSGTLIAPLLLLPFVENSFKHGAHSSTGLAEIKIFLLLKRNILNFSVENTFEPDSTRRDPSRIGIGMSNEIRQLELVYPGRHKLKTTQEEGWYKTFLSIDLSEDNPIL